MKERSCPRIGLSLATVLLASLAIQCGDSRTPERAPGGPCPELQGKPTADDYYCEVQKMVDFGPRLTGFPAHKAFLDYIEDTLVSSGFSVDDEVMPFRRWDPTEASLVLHTDSGDQNVTVAYPLVRSRFTEEGGLTLPLVHANDSSASQEDRIILDYAEYSAYDGIQGCRLKTGDNEREPKSKPFIYADVDPSVKGLICCLDKPLDRIEMDYQNFATTMVSAYDESDWLTSIPTLLLDEDTCKVVADAATNKDKATITLTGTYDEDTTRHLWGILPGKRTKEYILLGTHTDGQNAVEENGIAAKLAMARYFANLAKSGVEFEYSLLFVGVTGHMSEFDVPSAGTWGFCNGHKTLMDGVKTALNFEHLGVPEQDAGGAYGYYTSDPLDAELFNGTLIMETTDHLPVKIEHGRTPPMEGSAVGFRPGYCDLKTIAGVIYPWYYLNLKYGGIDKLNKEYLFQQADTIRSITEKLLRNQR